MAAFASFPLHRIVLAGLLVVACSSTYGAADAIPTDEPDADAGPVIPPDASTGPCDPSKPFGTPHEVAGITTPETEGGISLTPDELTAYFYAARAEAGPDALLYVAVRPSIDAPFGEARRLTISSGYDLNPSIRRDAKVLVFNRYGGSTNAIHIATRESTTADFTSTAVLSQLTPDGGATANPFLLPSGTAIYYSLIQTGNRGHLKRASALEDFAKSTDFPELEAEPGEYDPVVSEDEKTIYFNSFRAAAGAQGRADIYVATRADVGSPFNAPRNVTELNTSADDAPNWLSPDRCRLYFTSDRVRGDRRGDIYVAERGR